MKRCCFLRGAEVKNNELYPPTAHPPTPTPSPSSARSALVLRHVYNSSTPEVIAHNAALWLLYVSSLLSVAGLNCWWCFLITRILVRALLGIVRPAAAKAKAA